MESGKLSLNRLRELPLIVWLMPYHLEFETVAPVRECLQWLSADLNEMNKTTFKIIQATDDEATFTISRGFNRSTLDCEGMLHRQLVAEKTLLYIDMGNTIPMIYLVGAVIVSLLFTYGGRQQPFIANVLALLLIWLAYSLKAFQNYQTQRNLARDLQNLFLKHTSA